MSEFIIAAAILALLWITYLAIVANYDSQFSSLSDEDKASIKEME